MVFCSDRTLGIYWAAAFLGLVSLVPLSTGCGQMPLGNGTVPLLGLFGFSTPRDPSFAEPLKIVLDWDGGTSLIYANMELAGVDLAKFSTTDGATLADRADEFHNAVRNQIMIVLFGMPQARFEVVEGDGDHASGATVVHFTQEQAPNGRADVGEGEYDPCNTDRHDAAIVYGERLLQFHLQFTFDDWVRAFANICAHEIGHTLGYTHIPREEFVALDRQEFVELMLDGHTPEELRREQRIVIEQTTCPSEEQTEVPSQHITETADSRANALTFGR